MKKDGLFASYDAKQYRFLNRILLLCLFIVGCLITFFYMGTDVEVCWSRARYGKDCILCGSTRDFMALLSGCQPMHNAASIYIFVGLAIEIIYRILGAIICFSRRMMFVDLIYHILGAIVLVVASIMNLISNYVLN